LRFKLVFIKFTSNNIVTQIMSIDLHCSEKISLFFSCQDLPKVDFFSATDSFVSISTLDPVSKQVVILGNSSVIYDSQTPKWPDQLIVNYNFELIQEIVCKIYGYQGKGSTNDFKNHKYIGMAKFKLSELVHKRNQSTTIKLTEGYNQGEIHIRGETVNDTRDIFYCQFSAKNLTKKNGIIFGSSDPFLVITRCYEDGHYGVVWKNDPVMKNVNPAWPASRLPLQLICNGDIERPLKIEIFDFEKDGKHNSLGVSSTTVKELLDSNGAGIEIIDEQMKIKKGSSYKNSGTLFATHCYIERHPTFGQYVCGGLELHMMIAIDYTSSNGNVTDPSSLHYVSSNKANAYQNIISSIGQVITEYDHDNKFPVYGFGAKVKLPPPENGYSPTQHCFPIYGDGVEVDGVNGILDAYKDALKNVSLAGPTLFAPCIRKAQEYAKNLNCSQHNQKYQILLIITDGEINDMDATITAIIDASRDPLSIIIIGVGTADFSSMHLLDSDGKLLSNGRSQAARDIVQFVPYNKFASAGAITLAQEVLAEIPVQVIRYMEKKEIIPNIIHE